MMLKEREFDWIVINKNGWLQLERVRSEEMDLTPQLCPFCVLSGESARCGDWCPHFGEPEYENNKASLSLCAGTILRTSKDHFEDRR